MSRLGGKNSLLLVLTIVTLFSLFFEYKPLVSASSPSLDDVKVACGTFVRNDKCKIGGPQGCYSSSQCPNPNGTPGARCVYNTYNLQIFKNPTGKKTGSYIGTREYCASNPPPTCSSTCN